MQTDFHVAVAVGDFNGDGIPDLVTALSQDNGTHHPTSGVSVLLGNGDGTFQEARIIFGTGGNDPFGVAAGDFSGVGRDDIVVANTFSDNISILINSGESWDISAGPGSDPPGNRATELVRPDRFVPTETPPMFLAEAPNALEHPARASVHAAVRDHLFAAREDDAEFFLTAARRRFRVGIDDAGFGVLDEDGVSL